MLSFVSAYIQNSKEKQEFSLPVKTIMSLFFQKSMVKNFCIKRKYRRGKQAEKMTVAQCYIPSVKFLKRKMSKVLGHSQDFDAKVTKYGTYTALLQGSFEISKTQFLK